MKDQNHQYINNSNTQDIFLRNATLSLLDLLNREIIIDMVRGEVVEKHEIPVFYNFAGDEGFMKDFFTELPNDCKYPTRAEGNYDIYPRGIITLNSFQIRPGDLTNKFVRGSFNQEEVDDEGQKKLKAYSARLLSLPLTLKFSLKFESDNLNKAFKILEKIFDFYYKNQVKYFQFRGMRIPAQISFPETADIQKNYNFTYSDDTKVAFSLALDMETYFPSFDDYSVRFKGNTIRQFNIREKNEGNNAPINDIWLDQDNKTE